MYPLNSDHRTAFLFCNLANATVDLPDSATNGSSHKFAVIKHVQLTYRWAVVQPSHHVSQIFFFKYHQINNK